MKILLLLSVLFVSQFSFAQDLMQERIWKLSPRKKSIFLDKGIFHVNTGQAMGQIVSVRNSYVPSRGYERIVFDFNTNKIPGVYGHISLKNKKVYIDFFNTKLAKTIDGLKNTKFVKNIDFFGIDQGSLAVELTMNSQNTYDIFYLDNPGRLVIDIKK